MHWLAIGLSLGSAFASALSTTVKKAATSRLGARDSALDGIRSPLWVAGLGFDAVGVALQVLALHFGELALVQPLLVSGMLFALVLRRLVVRERFTLRELAWGLVLTACLVGFLFFSGAMSGSTSGGTADRGAAIVTGVATAGAIIGCLVLARRGVPAAARAAVLGVAVGAAYAITAALIKSATNVLAASGALSLFTSWQFYAVLLTGVGGQLLAAMSFKAGPLTASLPATATIDPLLSVLIGILIYDEQLHRGPLGGVVLLVLLLLLVAAVIQLGRVESETDRERRGPRSSKAGPPGVHPGGPHAEDAEPNQPTSG